MVCNTSQPKRIDCVNNWNTIEGGSEKKSVGGESNWKAGKVKEGKKTFCDNAR